VWRLISVAHCWFHALLVLGKCRELRQRLIEKAAAKTTPVQEDIPQIILEVPELPAPEHVLEGMESRAPYRSASHGHARLYYGYSE
jgi:hypothetical protein